VVLSAAMNTTKPIILTDRRLELRLSLDELGRRCGIERSKLSRGERGYVAFTEHREGARGRPRAAPRAHCRWQAGARPPRGPCAAGGCDRV